MFFIDEYRGRGRNRHNVGDLWTCAWRWVRYHIVHRYGLTARQITQEHARQVYCYLSCTTPAYLEMGLLDLPFPLLGFEDRIPPWALGRRANQVLRGDSGSRTVVIATTARSWHPDPPDSLSYSPISPLTVPSIGISSPPVFNPRVSWKPPGDRLPSMPVPPH